MTSHIAISASGLFSLRNQATTLAASVLVGAGLLSVFAPLIAPFPPEQANPAAILEPPTPMHWMGTDVNGMDVLSRLLWGGRIDLGIAIGSTLIALMVGTALGTWAGNYFGKPGWQGLLSEGLLRSMDVLQAFPIFVFALGLVAMLGRNIYNLLYVLAFLETPIFLRLTRSRVLGVREETYVYAARCSGNSQLRLLLRHILPNSLSPALINASALMGGAILLTAGLSFVGAGVPAPTAEWGYMVAVGARDLYTGEWWTALFPGAYIGVVVMSLAVVGDALRQYLDPTSRTLLMPAIAASAASASVAASGPG